MKNILILLLSITSILFSGILIPENGRLIKTVHVLFEWEQEIDAVAYNLQISTDESFNDIISDINVYKTIHIEKNILDWNDDYYWRVRSIYIDNSFSIWVDQSMFTIAPSALQNFDVSFYNEDLIGDGLIIFGQFAPDLIMGVIDKYGNEIWNSGVPESDHQLGSLLNHVSKSGQLFGKSNTSAIQINYHEDIIWQSPSNTIIDLHEVQQLPNGNYMSFVPIFEYGPIAEGWWTNQFRALGYEADGQTIEFPWLAQRIVEWDKDTGEEVWSWNPFEHFDIFEHDTGGELWWDAYVSGRFDWIHSNSFYFDQEESVIYVSHRHLNKISKTAYPSGEILWSIGLPEQYGFGNDNICTDLLFSWQHHVQLLENGELLFFDNGNLSETLLGDDYPTSRARRIRVNQDLTCDTIWEYELPENLFGPGTGSIQLLENGNYSIYTLGGYVDCSILEVTPDKELVWKAEASDPTSSLYRAYKIPSMYPEAFSVLAGGYTQDITGPVIEFSGNELVFNITNHSGYTNIYKYNFENPEADWFEDVVGEIIIEPYQTESISFIPIQTDNDTQVLLSIYPNHHNYAEKQLNFSIVASEELLGDLNDDDRLTIADIILMVNMVLDLEDNQNLADMNQDGGINILDLSILINIILNTNRS